MTFTIQSESSEISVQTTQLYSGNA